ncbi:MAG: DUF2007 domain-containing protein [Thermoanaerobaculia bacterium]
MTNDQDDDPVEIASFPYLHIAEFAASVLEGSGVESFLGDQFLGGVRPDLTFTSGGVKLFVRTSDVDRALEVLAEFDAAAEELLLDSAAPDGEE